MLAVNLKGVFLCSQAVLPRDAPPGYGRIVNMASSGGQLGGPLAPHYAASKAGVISLTRSLARLAAPARGRQLHLTGLDRDRDGRRGDGLGGWREKLRRFRWDGLGGTEDVAASVVFLAASAPY